MANEENTQEVQEQVADTLTDNTPEPTEQVDDSLQNIQEFLNSGNVTVNTTNGTTEEPSNKEETTENTTEEPVEKPKVTEPTEIIIDDSIIERYNSLKPLKGKTIDEIGKSYEEARKELTKTQQELAKLKKETIENIDPIEDPEGFKNQILDATESIKEKAKEEVKEEVKVITKEEFARLKKEEAETKKAVQDFLDDFQKSLPNGVLIDSAIELFKSKNKLTDKDLRFYKLNPERFKKDVVMAVENEILKEQIDVKSRSKAYDILHENIRKSKSSVNQPVNSQVQFKSEDLSEEDKLVNDVFDLSFDENDWK